MNRVAHGHVRHPPASVSHLYCVVKLFNTTPQLIFVFKHASHGPFLCGDARGAMHA